MRKTVEKIMSYYQITYFRFFFPRVLIKLRFFILKLTSCEKHANDKKELIIMKNSKFYLSKS